MTPAQAFKVMPKHLVVGAYVYTLKPVKIAGGDAGNMAHVDTEAQTIEIKSSLASPAAIVGSALHEVMHIIWGTSGLAKRADEESAILAFDSGLTLLFQKNPAFLVWVQKCLK